MTGAKDDGAVIIIDDEEEEEIEDAGIVANRHRGHFRRGGGISRSDGARGLVGSGRPTQRRVVVLDSDDDDNEEEDSGESGGAGLIEVGDDDEDDDQQGEDLMQPSDQDDEDEDEDGSSLDGFIASDNEVDEGVFDDEDDDDKGIMEDGYGEDYIDEFDSDGGGDGPSFKYKGSGELNLEDDEMDRKKIKRTKDLFGKQTRHARMVDDKEGIVEDEDAFVGRNDPDYNGKPAARRRARRVIESDDDGTDVDVGGKEDIMESKVQLNPIEKSIKDVKGSPQKSLSEHDMRPMASPRRRTALSNPTSPDHQVNSNAPPKSTATITPPSPHFERKAFNVNPKDDHEDDDDDDLLLASASDLLFNRIPPKDGKDVIAPAHSDNRYTYGAIVDLEANTYSKQPDALSASAMRRQSAKKGVILTKEYDAIVLDVEHQDERQLKTLKASLAVAKMEEDRDGDVVDLTKSSSSNADEEMPSDLNDNVDVDHAAYSDEYELVEEEVISMQVSEEYDTEVQALLPHLPSVRGKTKQMKGL
jgi:hypothetical protein